MQVIATRGGNIISHEQFARRRRSDRAIAGDVHAAGHGCDIHADSLFRPSPALGLSPSWVDRSRDLAKSVAVEQQRRALQAGIVVDRQQRCERGQ